MLRNIVCNILVVLHDEDLFSFADSHLQRLVLHAELWLVVVLLVLGKSNSLWLQLAGVKLWILVRFLCVGMLRGQDDGEGTSLTLNAVHSHCAVHGFYGELHQRQTDTCSNLLTQALTLIEGVEDVRCLPLGNATSSVEHQQLNLVAPLLHCDVNLAVLRRIFHAV